MLTVTPVGLTANVVHNTGLRIDAASGITHFCYQDYPDQGTGLRRIESIEDAKALEGVEVGLSDWVVIDQHRIDQFAEATGDYQWIHVDTERAAKEMPNGKTISHGYLTLALIPSLTGGFVEVVNLERAINYGLNKVRFYAPVYVGSKMRARSKVLQVRKRAGAMLLTSETRLEVEDERKPACVAETLGMYFFQE